ncbi:MAG: hypothetical protein HC767_14265 [Akkermansiaceae bacterium]|nr:hypothetical protein [Akkermansiaceae bacterium]
MKKSLTIYVLALAFLSLLHAEELRYFINSRYGIAAPAAMTPRNVHGILSFDDEKV